MAAKTESTLTREAAEIRWHILETRAARFDRQPGVSQANSRIYERMNAAVDELAARLVDEVSDSDCGELVDLWEGVWEEIHERLVTWAVDFDARRDARAALMRAASTPAA